MNLRPLKVLVSGDSEDHIIDLMRRFRAGGYDMDFLRVQDEAGLREALAAGGWDLVVADHPAASITAHAAVRTVRASGLELPVVVVSGVAGEGFAVEAVKAGADEYILKWALEGLVPAVERSMADYEARKVTRRAQEEIALLNKLLQTITEVDKLIARETDTGRIMDEACRMLVARAGFKAAWIGKADFERRTVEPLAKAGCAEGFIEAACAGGGSGYWSGQQGSAISQGKRIVCKDARSDGTPLPMCGGAREFGFRCCASFPLFLRGDVFGCLSVYSDSDWMLDRETVDLLEGLASDLGYALQSVEEAAERRRTAEAVRGSEERLRTIFESSMDGMFVIDMEGRYIDVNRAGCAMFGYTREEFLSSDVSLLIFPERRHMIKEHRAAHWKTGGFLPEMRLRRKDGGEIWVDLAITPFRVGDKELVLGVKRDITARRKAEESVRENEERFRQIFEQNLDPQLLVDLECRVIDANPAAIGLFGYTREEAAGLACSALLNTAGEDERVKEALREGRGFEIARMEARRKDGSPLTVSARGQAIRLKDSTVVLCTVKDLSEMLRMEEEARYMQAKLIHANKMTSIGTLASGVAHEINNPNNFILFNSALLTEAWKDGVKILERYYRENGDFSLGGLPYSEMVDVIPELLTGITDGSRRIKGIVDNLKDFSRAGKGGCSGECDVNTAVMASASILRSQIMKYTDSFEVSCAEELPHINGNAQKVEQVLINLILNALHALPDKRSGVSVTTRLDGGSVVVEVTDQGAGMTREVLERITEPFYTTKSSRGGTGLGLYISYTIMKEHKGSMEFFSEPGAGTTVKLSFPVPGARAD